MRAALAAASAAVGELLAVWVRYREAQVAELTAEGVRDAGEIAARLDMTVEAAAEYLARVDSMDVHRPGAVFRESRGGEEVLVPRVAGASPPPRGV